MLILRLWSETILHAFEVIGRESHDDYGRRGTGVLAMLKNFSVFYGLKLSYYGKMDN